MTNIMRSVSVNNKEILQILEKFKNLWYDDIENFKKSKRLWAEERKREYFISDEYKNKIINQGSEHDGYPEIARSYSLKSATGSPVSQNNVVESFSNNFYFVEKYIELNRELSIILGSKHNALCSVYPPGGFISWHNNANASAYNVIFTWSENGNGYWKHVDPHTKKEVTIQDVPGWQCKSFYFGSYKDGPNDLVYHMASTDCWRMTISYIFDGEHKDYWKYCIDEIENND